MERKDTKDRDRLRREKLSGFFLDMAKLTFSASVLTGIAPAFTTGETLTNLIYISAGILATVGFYMIGKNILK